MTTYPNAEYWRKRAVTNAQARNGYMRHGRAQADKLDLAEGQIRFFEWQVREYSSTQNKHLARIDELEAQVEALAAENRKLRQENRVLSARSQERRYAVENLRQDTGVVIDILEKALSDSRNKPVVGEDEIPF